MPPHASASATPDRQATLGRNGPAVSRIGLGLAALGRPGYMTAGHDADLGTDKSVDAMRRRAHEVLDAAWERGVRYFDAARSYGRAEEFLASWIEARGIAPSDITVGSKWGYRYMAGWQTRAEVHEVKNHTLATLREQISETRQHLGAHLDLYQIHSATLESGVLDDRRVLDELADLRDDGLLIGLSLSGPGQAATLARAMSIERGGTRLFQCVQATWNLLEPSAAPALADAHDAGMGVIVKEVLANGYLVPGAPGSPYDIEESPLAEEARRLGVEADALALAAALAQRWADCVLSGAVRTEHLEANLAARRLVVTDDVLHRLGAIAMLPAEYWRRRSTLAWS